MKADSVFVDTMNLIGDRAVVFGGSDGAECFSDVFILDLSQFRLTPPKGRDESTYVYLQTPSHGPKFRSMLPLYIVRGSRIPALS